MAQSGTVHSSLTFRPTPLGCALRRWWAWGGLPAADDASVARDVAPLAMSVIRWLTNLCLVAYYDKIVIGSFKSRALKRLWERDDKSKIPAQSATRITLVLDALDAAAAPEDLDLPGLGFHPLTGNLKGRYAVTVTRNWRITFAWEDGDAVQVNFEDYHSR